MATQTFDVVVVGAGVFGAWTALHLARRKQRVLLVEAYGAANSRASSGGESRIIRMSYGPDEIYTRWSQNSLRQWKELFEAMGQNLFQQTGVLWLSAPGDPGLGYSIEALRRCHVTHTVFDQSELQNRYPQMSLDGISRGLLEPDSGVLLARRAVACAVKNALREGVQFEIAQVQKPDAAKMLVAIETDSSGSVLLRHSARRHTIRSTSAAHMAAPTR
jgi:sarcosine oxidase